MDETRERKRGREREAEREGERWTVGPEVKSCRKEVPL